MLAMGWELAIIDKVRAIGVPVVFAVVITAMLGWAYIYGPNFAGAPAPQELPEEEVRLVRIPLEEAFKISSQIVQLLVSISFGLFVIVGYALSREQRNVRALSVIDVVAGCAFVCSAFICFYLAYQLRYGQYAAIQHRYTEDALRQTIAWFNEVHAILAFWVGVSAIPAFFIVARVLFVGQASDVHVRSVEAPRQQVVQEPAESASVRVDGTTLETQSEKQTDVRQEKSND